MRSALLMSVVMGWCMRRPAHQASAKPSSSTTPPSAAGDEQRLAHLAALHANRSGCAPRRNPAQISSERISTSTSPTVCGVSMPGMVCTLARTGVMVLRVMVPA